MREAQIRGHRPKEDEYANADSTILSLKTIATTTTSTTTTILNWPLFTIISPTTVSSLIGEVQYNVNPRSSPPPSKAAFFNLEDHVTGPLYDVQTPANLAEYLATVANIFIALVAHKAQNDVVEAFEAGDVRNAMCTLSAGCHGNGGGAVVNNSYPTNNGKRFGARKGSKPQAAAKDKKAHFQPE